MSTEPEKKNEDLDEDVPTKVESPIAIMKLVASVEGMRTDLRTGLDDLRSAFARMEANYRVMYHEFSNQLTEHAARLDTLERRVRRTAPLLRKKKSKK